LRAVQAKLPLERNSKVHGEPKTKRDSPFVYGHLRMTIRTGVQWCNASRAVNETRGSEFAQR
jgi:hypothetical protein